MKELGQCLLCLEMVEAVCDCRVGWLDGSISEHAELCAGCVATVRRSGARIETGVFLTNTRYDGYSYEPIVR